MHRIGAEQGCPFFKHLGGKPSPGDNGPEAQLVALARLGHQFARQQAADAPESEKHHIFGGNFRIRAGIFELIKDECLGIVEIVVFFSVVFVGELADVQLGGWQLYIADGPQQFHRVEDGDGFLHELPGIFMQVDDIADVFVDDLVPEQHHLDRLVIPEIAYELDEFGGGLAAVGLEGKFFFVVRWVHAAVDCLGAKLCISNILR